VWTAGAVAELRERPAGSPSRIFGHSQTARAPATPAHLRSAGTSVTIVARPLRHPRRRSDQHPHVCFRPAGIRARDRLRGAAGAGRLVRPRADRLLRVHRVAHLPGVPDGAGHPRAALRGLPAQRGSWGGQPATEL